MANIFISGLARFRTTPGKIKMLERNQLTAARLVKYTLVAKPDLRDFALSWITDHPEVHLSVVNNVQSYLSSTREMEFISSHDSIETGGEYEGCWTRTTTTSIYSFRVRERAGNLLQVIHNATTTSLTLRAQIESMIGAAPPSQMSKSQTIF